MVPEELAASVFDTDLFAATPGAKLKRSVQLGGAYYLRALPRYLAARRRLDLGWWDGGALVNPFRELRPRNYAGLPLPPHYVEALRRLDAGGVRLSMPRLRLEALLGAWWEARDVPGAAIECGAYRGATGLLIAVLGMLNGVARRTLLLDTFTGSPAAGPHDHMREAGEYAPGDDWPRVLRGQAEALGIGELLEVHQGLFSDTFASLAAPPELELAFIHVDANTYDSTLEACRFTLDRAAPGAVVVLDDYNGVLDLGARLAIDECLAHRHLTPIPLAWSSAYVRAGGEANS